MTKADAWAPAFLVPRASAYGFFFFVVDFFVVSTVVVAPVLMPIPAPMAPVVAPVDAPTPGVYVGGVAIAPAVAPAVESYAVLSPRLHAPKSTSATIDVAATVNFRVIRFSSEGGSRRGGSAIRVLRSRNSPECSARSAAVAGASER